MSSAKRKGSILGRLRGTGSKKPGQGVSEIFLCTGPDCCRREVGLAAWKHLQRRAKDSDLKGRVMVKRTSCMNVCGEGPIAVVYPDRVFYSEMDEPGIDRVLKSHIVQGKPVDAKSFEAPDDVKEPPHRS